MENFRESVREDSLDPHETSFAWVDLLEGGTEAGFASPDNMAFGPSADDLWVVTASRARG